MNSAWPPSAASRTEASTFCAQALVPDAEAMATVTAARSAKTIHVISTQRVQRIESLKLQPSRSGARVVAERIPIYRANSNVKR